MEQSNKLYTVRVSYKVRVEANCDDQAIRNASYAILNASYAIPSEDTTHLEMKVLGARAIVETPPPTPAEAPVAVAEPDIPL